MSSPAAAGEEEEEEEEAARWSREDEKAFENAVATVPYPSVAGGAAPSPAAEDRWLEAVAARVPGKKLFEVKKHYGFLLDDVNAIDAGRVPIPRYADDSASSPRNGEQAGKKQLGFSDRKAGGGGFDSGGLCKGGSKSDLERKKGIPWTEEEHRLFLLGLEKFGKGDWRSISRNFVVSRTPTQVASHAQKYFIRLNSINRDRRRSSIHDITNVNGGDVPASQGPITGQGIVNSAPAVGSFMNQPPQPNMPAMGIYGTPMGHPVPGHMVSAVGTPVMLPPGHVPYVMPVAYPIPPTMHQ